MIRWFWFATILLILLVIAISIGRWFLLLLALPIFDAMFTRFFNWELITPKVKIKIPFVISLLLWIIVSGFILRTFFIDSLAVMTPGMQPSLARGDHILSSKLHYGARLPITPINFPLAHHYLPFSRCRKSYTTAIELDYHRLRGTKKIQRGDLISYNFPEGDSVICGVETMSYYALKRLKESKGELVRKEFLHYRPIDRREMEISRCIGLPGDTIVIKQKEVRVNGKIASYGLVRYDYLVELSEGQLSRSFLAKLGLEQADITIFPELGYALPLFPDQVQLVASRPQVKSVTPYTISEGKGNLQIFPHTSKQLWNRDNFGPLIIPRKGMTVNLTIENLPFYKRIISNYEKSTLKVIDGVIFINGSPTNEYVIKQNYFFMLGDNRHHSRDSRHWGFLPEDHIIGKPLFIWLSLRNDVVNGFKPNWNRFFRLPK